MTIKTDAKKGPGLGDVLVYYRNARVAWVMEDGQVQLFLLDHGPLVQLTTELLLQDLEGLQNGTLTPATTASKLDALTVDSLLDLDPLVASSLFPTLPSSRFTPETTLQLGGGVSYQQSLSHTRTITDRQSTSRYSTKVTDSHAGWLSLIGIGITENSQVKTTVTVGSARQEASADTVATQMNLSAAAGESYEVEVYFDQVFGSFLFKKPTSVLSPIIIAATRR
jgi:hypothetical protein